MGIRQYEYEPHGDAYNVAFEQPSRAIDIREFVVYNPHAAQTMTSHAIDLLQFAGAELELRRGFVAVRATRHAGWKYFLFD
jgi:hypothetical protein